MIVSTLAILDPCQNTIGCTPPRPRSRPHSETRFGYFAGAVVEGDYEAFFRRIEQVRSMLSVKRGNGLTQEWPKLRGIVSLALLNFRRGAKDRDLGPEGSNSCRANTGPSTYSGVTAL